MDQVKKLVEISFKKLIGKHSIIFGNSNTKKTYYTGLFVNYLLENKINPKEISILEFAPDLILMGDLKIGGKIEDYFPEVKKCNLLAPTEPIIPPRLHSRNKSELYHYITRNFNLTSILLEKYKKDPTPFLIINDISIFLHKGNRRTLMNVIKKSNTFLGNSYYGDTIKKEYSVLLDLREKNNVKYLIKRLDLAFFSG
ncbi:MAG: hypothetical protein ACP6IY_05210 [Promethearchaeia archaeon]